MTRTPSYIGTLVELYSLGAYRRQVGLSTASLGTKLGLSQQAVSNHLLQLEREGLVERTRMGRGTRLLITPAGADALLGFYSRLRQAMENGTGPLEFHGRVFTGLGEGAYYIRLPGYRRQFSRLLGFDPYPGTLNLTLARSELDLRKQLNRLPGLEVHGFTDGRRTYGPVKCFRATVEGKFEAGALVIERTHHGDAVLELISPHNLRKKLSLKDGKTVLVAVHTGD